jgi:hypothetical protein
MYTKIRAAIELRKKKETDRRHKTQGLEDLGFKM